MRTYVTPVDLNTYNKTYICTYTESTGTLFHCTWLSRYKFGEEVKVIIGKIMTANGSQPLSVGFISRKTQSKSEQTFVDLSLINAKMYYTAMEISSQTNQWVKQMLSLQQ